MTLELESLIAAGIAFGVPTITAAFLVWGKLSRLDEKVSRMSLDVKKLADANGSRMCEVHQTEIGELRRRIDQLEK